MEMKLAIMQPYFFPYIGYWQLMNAVDAYVVYDNIQYTKKGYINRNRILLNGQERVFTIPLQRASDYLDVCQRRIAPTYERKKMLALFETAYKRAPYFEETFALLQKCVNYESDILFDYIYKSIIETADFLGIQTKIIRSSDVPDDHSLKGADRVIDICKKVGAATYVNNISGSFMYDEEVFNSHGLALSFFTAEQTPYKQFTEPFVPFLSIIDVMMFCGKDGVAL